MRSKKADLALSTNAIVVLIIAVLILGLLISFITGVFNVGGDKFEAILRDIPDPVVTSSSPLVANGVTAVRRGDDAAFKIGAYNTEPDEASIDPSVTCDVIDPLTITDPAARTVSGFGTAQWTVAGKVLKSASIGQHVCTVTATIGGRALASDFVILVKE